MRIEIKTNQEIPFSEELAQKLREVVGETVAEQMEDVEVKVEVKW